MKHRLFRSLCVCTVVLAAATARAQTPAGCSLVLGDSEAKIGENHFRLVGNVEIDCGTTKIYAEETEMFLDENRVVATGNVVVAQSTNRIAAERAEFDTRTHLGTFYNATGIAILQPQAQRRPTAGPAPPLVVGREDDVYFYGERVEKIGPKKYRITDGGFTTCVQPTPRWQLTSQTVILNVDHYTLLRQAILTVKGVPLLYVPLLYYPTKKEQRATGFLIPTYGSSTLRGQSLHDAFFWAVDRSQDATFFHDWFSKTGQGVGSEYRYNFGGGSDGQMRAYMLDTHAADYVQPDGTVTSLAPSRSFEIHGGANQLLPGNLRARAQVDYFSNLQTMQTFSTNVFAASQNTRSYGGNIVGAWGTYTLNGTFDHNEYFYGPGNSGLMGNWPRIDFSRNERPLFGTDLYFSVASEFASLLHEVTNPGVTTGPTSVDSGLTRLDLTPQIRYPFKKFQWFTVNSVLSWRDTYYSRSLDPSTETVLDAGINRRYYTMSAQAVGPVFNRVWDTPDNGYAEKFKHTIEPYVNVTRTSSIDNFNEIVQTDATDTIVGGVTQYAYGVRNRFFAKRKLTPGQPGQSREILDVEVDQTYYTNSQASQFDPTYTTSFTGAPPSNFSPIALSVRALPTDQINATMRAEFDSRYHSLRTLSASGTYTIANMLQTTIGWSKKGYIPQLVGFNDPAFLDQYLNASTNVHTRDNRLGTVYSFNYDVRSSTMLQQSVSAFYNAQCCGVAFQYQSFNFGGISSFAVPVPADHRFFISFTLAGLGNFSPMNGAMAGVPH